MFKLLKWGVIGGAAAALVGFLVLGTDVFSYAKSSKKLFQASVKETIPVEFEIQRARDLLEDLIPEMHANLRTVAKEEVETAALEKEVKADRESVALERNNIHRLRRSLDTLPTSAEAGAAHQGSLEDLSLRFERFRTAEMLLSGKEKLLQNRKKSLGAAIGKLEKTRLGRVELAAQIEALEGQFRLIQAQGTTSDLRLDTTKLAQTQRLLGDLRKRLEIAQRVLERESNFADPLPMRQVTREGLAEEIDTFFQKGPGVPETAAAPGARAEAENAPASTVRAGESGRY